MIKQKFPAINDVARAVRELSRSIVYVGTEGCDIYLAVGWDGAWDVMTGKAVYKKNQDGYWGFWGCSWLPGKKFNSREKAKELLKDVKENYCLRTTRDL